MSTFSYGDSLVDLHFALWVLTEDGLQVPPFDAHPEGDQQLRDVGLRAEDWRQWVRALIEAEERARYQLMSLAVRARGAFAQNPAQVWAGPPAVANALDALWQQYRTTVWPATIDLLHEHRRMIASMTHQSWWLNLPSPESFDQSWTFYSVAYPRIVWYPVTPSSLIITDLGCNLSQDQYRRTIQRAHAVMGHQEELCMT